MKKQDNEAKRASKTIRNSISQPPTPKSAQQIAELTEALQRSQADLVNFRARAEREKLELTNYVKAEVVTGLLPLIDNLERALGHLPKELADNDWAKGVSSVAKQVQDTLAKLGVERIKTVGELFDPGLHEAVSVDGETGEEVVSEELQTGYRLDNTVLRPAMVRVKRRIKK
jgi:molecular chaperone GrpE